MAKVGCWGYDSMLGDNGSCLEIWGDGFLEVGEFSFNFGLPKLNGL